MPVVQDVLAELESLTSRARAKFIPAEVHELTQMWLRLVQISDALGDVLRLHYRVGGPGPDAAEIDHLSRRLQSLTPNNAMTDLWDDNLRIHAYQTELFYQSVQPPTSPHTASLTRYRAAIAILYRPYVLNDSGSPPSGVHAQWQRNAIRRARDAASGTNALLQSLIELDAIKYLKPMMYENDTPACPSRLLTSNRITAMVPAMQIHLADCKSTSALTCGLARNKLQLCMLVLSDLRQTYWSANVMYRLFERGQALLTNGEVKTAGAPTNANANGLRSATTPDHDRDHRIVVEQMPPQNTHDESVMSAVPEPALVLNEPLDPLWFNISPQFSNVDQLLSPGFSLSEDVFLDFFPNYPNVAYGQALLPNVADETMYYVV